MYSLEEKKLLAKGVLEKVLYLTCACLEDEKNNLDALDLWEVMGRALVFLQTEFHDYLETEKNSLVH